MISPLRSPAGDSAECVINSDFAESLSGDSARNGKKTRLSEEGKKTRLSEEGEKTRLNEEGEKTRLNEEGEKTRLSEEGKKTRLGEEGGIYTAILGIVKFR
jgi:hypothetical protein